MTLRRQFLVVIAGTVAAIAAITGFSSRYLLARSSLRLEDQVMRDDIRRAVNVIRAELSSLDRLASDRAASDATYDFMATHSEAYKNANLCETSYRNLGLSVMVLVRGIGQIDYGKVFNANSGGLENLPMTLVSCLVQRSPLLRDDRPGGSVAGILVINGRILLLASRPILTSANGGPSRGWLIVGRDLDNAAFERFSRLTRLSIDVLPWIGEVNSGLEKVGGSRGLVSGEVWFHRQDANTIIGFANLADLYGKPALTLSVTSDRMIYRQYVANMRYTLAWLFLLGLCLAAGTIWTLDKYVLAVLSSSLAALQRAVSGIAAGATLSARIEKRSNDELGRLADAINGMLGALENTQKESERRRVELMQTHKMASLGTLVSGIAHEINNPNNVVMLNAEILCNLFGQMGPVLEERFRADPEFMLGDRKYREVRGEIPLMLNEVRESSRRITDMIEELRKFGRIEADSRGGVDINAVVNSAIRLMRHEISRHTERFSVELAENLPPVSGSFQKLEQVVINLVNNACQALGDNHRGIHVSTLLSGGGRTVEIRIRDEGRGITAGNLAKLGTPFYTTRSVEGGCGLGLSVSLNIVKEHGGSIVFESEIDKGTLVTVILPAGETHET